MITIKNGVLTDIDPCKVWEYETETIPVSENGTLVIPSADKHGQPVVEIKDICVVSEDIYDVPIKTVVIPDTIRTIREDAFSGLNQLAEIHIPASVESISAGFANHCFSLNKITVDPENMFYDSRDNCNAVICKKTNTLVQGCGTSIIPRGVKVIGQSAFSGCKQLSTIAIPDSVTTISDEAFEDCSNLENIVIPSSVRKIGDSAFRSCGSLTSLHLPDNIEEIGSYAFADCNNINYMRIPSEVKIKDNAFDYFSKHIIILTTLPKAKELIDRFHDYLEVALFAILYKFPYDERIEVLDVKGVLDKI